MTAAQQSWCVVCRYPTKREFVFGTIFVPIGEHFHRREEIARNALDEIFPSRPKIVGYQQGQILFHPEGT